ncbi:hypothetical protein HID58_079741 [Brassica napus]|uniref:BnaC08g08800D protein n=5 Tax=Brassica TaxID=3705 RepID=A0A078G0B4_BRANA|nr:hypothetical protein HID58_079741 [Brassica napus]CAF2106757.1 unnamed protein product [Brassica napus]CDY18736.1 BnaC08g08800D [Brassica napus]VDD54394.1 unnamed protein product [Brassica oleracea]
MSERVSPPTIYPSYPNAAISIYPSMKSRYTLNCCNQCPLSIKLFISPKLFISSIYFTIKTSVYSKSLPLMQFLLNMVLTTQPLSISASVLSGDCRLAPPFLRFTKHQEDWRWRFIYRKIRESRSENGQIHEKIKITNNDTEPTEPTSLGVCTRAAKTLALKRLNSSTSDSAVAGDSSCYLQLRSRRLKKPPALTEPKQPLMRIKEHGSKVWVSSGSGSVHVAQSCNGDDWFGKSEAFCGEDSPDFESRQRFVILCPSFSSSYQFDETHLVFLFVLFKYVSLSLNQDPSLWFVS